MVAAINGFGRFGLHLLKYWLERNQEANFIIRYINDDTLTLEAAHRIICHDKHVSFSKYKIHIKDDALHILEPNGSRHVIWYSNRRHGDIPWLGKPDVVLECSGKNLSVRDCDFYLTKNVKLVVISATSWDADKTLIYGFNHTCFEGKERVISYGSCTVNAYVPLANYIHQKYGIVESDVNVIHNVQEYKLTESNTLNRKFCTLERSGIRLLPFLNPSNFLVNYTVVPYTGVSSIDIRFRVTRSVTMENFVEDLKEEFLLGKLKHLYDFDEADIGPEVYNCSTYSVTFIQEHVKFLQEGNIYLHGYLDTENSVNRYFDLVKYICSTDALKNVSTHASVAGNLDFVPEVM